MSAASVVSIHLGRKLALMSDGAIGRITSMLDGDGEETAEVGEARAVVVEHDGRYHVEDAGNFDFSVRAQ